MISRGDRFPGFGTTQVWNLTEIIGTSMVLMKRITTLSTNLPVEVTFRDYIKDGVILPLDMVLMGQCLLIRDSL